MFLYGTMDREASDGFVNDDVDGNNDDTGVGSWA